MDARIHYLDRLRAIPLAVTRLLAIKDLWAIKSHHQPITPRKLPLGSPLSPTAPCAKWLRYPIGTCANRLSTATGDYIIITTTWFSQSHFPQKGVCWRDRELLQNCPIVFLALRPGVRAGGRGGSAKTAIRYYWLRLALGVTPLRGRSICLNPIDLLVQS